MSDVRTTIAEVLNLFPECKWDRFITNDEQLDVYGWLAVDQFLLLRFSGLDDATLVSWVCSDRSQETDIAERLGVEQGLVQRVSDVFGPMVAGAVQR